MGTLGIVVDAAPGNMCEHALAFFHHGKPGQSGGLNPGRAGELGGTTDGSGFVGVFSDDKKNGEFVIAEDIWRGGDGNWSAVSSMVRATPGDCQRDQVVNIAKAKPACLAKQGRGWAGGRECLGEGWHGKVGSRNAEGRKMKMKRMLRL
jgi:hypothetical protein